MEDEKRRITEVNAENGKVSDKDVRRPWHRPPITRIEIKRTMWGSFSGADSSNFATP